jgi:hypothetical protein
MRRSWWGMIEYAWGVIAIIFVLWYGKLMYDLYGKEDDEE